MKGKTIKLNLIIAYAVLHWELQDWKIKTS